MVTGSFIAGITGLIVALAWWFWPKGRFSLGRNLSNLRFTEHGASDRPAPEGTEEYLKSIRKVIPDSLSAEDQLTILMQFPTISEAKSLVIERLSRQEVTR